MQPVDDKLTDIKESLESTNRTLIVLGDELNKHLELLKADGVDVVDIDLEYELTSTLLNIGMSAVNVSQCLVK